MVPLARAIENAAATIKDCPACGNLDTVTPCRICQDRGREHRTLCIVAQVGDLWAVERTKAYRGQYHVLGGLLSAINGTGPENLRIGILEQRVRDEGFEEIILALSATVDGQSTAHYLMDHLSALPVKVTRLAHGVPVGGELDYLDDGTIATALKSRASL